MGSSDIARVDLGIFAVGLVPRRRAVAAPRRARARRGRYLYATLNGEGHVVKLDTDDRQRRRAGHDRIARRGAWRSPSDGTALYVVNYESNTGQQAARRPT